MSDGKGRLGPALDDDERAALITGMLVQTVGVLARWAACAGVHVISRDAALLAIGERHGAAPVVEAHRSDLNLALMAGREAALAARATAVLCLPADLPLLGQACLDRLLDAADGAIAAGNGRPVVVAAPADARGGTNALLLSPPDTIEPVFGGASLEAHVRAAAAADATLQLVVDPLLGFDLDTPEDLRRLERAGLEEVLAVGNAALSASAQPIEPLAAERR